MASSSTSNASSRQAKVRTALEHKASGNEAFIKGDLTAALRSYHHAVLYLSGLENRSILGLVGENSGAEGKPEDLSSDEESDTEPSPAAGGAKEGVVGEKEEQVQLAIVYSNMAAVYLRQKNYTRAIESAEKALKCDSRNVKAKFRKAQAMRFGGDLYKAQAFLKTSIEGLKRSKKRDKDGVVGDFEKELKEVEKAIEAKEGMARNKWKGFWGRILGCLMWEERKWWGGRVIRKMRKGHLRLPSRTRPK